jgi:hypothetical protein
VPLKTEDKTNAAAERLNCGGIWQKAPNSPMQGETPQIAADLSDIGTSRK